MSFDVGRDVVNRPDKIERHLAVLVDLMREMMGKPPESKGWTLEEYDRVGREMRSLSRAANRRPERVDPDDPLPPSGGTDPEEFFARRER